MNKKYDKDTLLALGFEEIAAWQIENGVLVYTPLNPGTQYKAIAGCRNVLYAFATDLTVHYIGKTTRSIKQRFLGYCTPGSTQQTNKKCNQNIKDLLSKGSQVSILVFSSDEMLQYGQFVINLAAGLEDNLIEALRPAWNGTGKGGQLQTESIVNEEIAEPIPPTPTLPPTAKAPPTSSTPEWEKKPHFNVDMQRWAYRQKGFLNVPKDVDRFVGAHDEQIQLFLGALDSDPLNSTITRTANTNGTARIKSRQTLAQWFQDHFKSDDQVTVYILDRNTFLLPTNR